MFKKNLAPLLALLIILTGCQSLNSNGQNEENLLIDSKELYQAIKNEEEDAFDLITSYRESYVENYKDYKNQEELIANLDSLSGAYISYYGSDNDENKQIYKEKLTSLLTSLETKLNN